MKHEYIKCRWVRTVCNRQSILIISSHIEQVDACTELLHPFLAGHWELTQVDPNHQTE